MIKKYHNNSWVEIPYRKYGTSTDTITTPADIYANDNNATVGLKGNMSQSSTPTPTNPIQPQECGERTGNLFDKSTVIAGYRFDSYGELFPASGYSASDYIPVSANESYIRNIYINTNKCVCFYKSDKTFISRQTSGTSITTPAETAYIRTSCATDDINNLMLVQGNTTPSEYIPYGYKIPISSANTTTPVYLGEAQSTRRIKKLVLTGEESWSEQTTNTFRVHDLINDALCPANGSLGISNMYTQVPYSFINTMDDGQFTYAKPVGTYTRFAFKNTSCADVTAWKAYLAQQYANGTPVCVWYVLETETTGIVNEPLRKIGDYVDTVSGITIPTISGKDTFDVETTLKPSEVSLSYTGWHDASVKEKSRNLFDEKYSDITTSLTYRAVNVGNGSFTLSTNAPLVNNGALVFLLAGNVTTGASTSNNGVSESISRTVNSVDGYITIAYLTRSGSSPVNYETMLNSGSTALPYEPYWT